MRSGRRSQTPTAERKEEIIMTNYEIRENKQFNSREVYFDGKPSRATLDALKALKMRWNHVKACWYGFAQECDLINAIITNDRDGEDITGEKTEDEDGKGQTISISDYYSSKTSAAEQEKIRISAAACEYHREAESENDVNYYHIDKYKVYTPETMEIIKKVNSIVSAYRYDESNAMVDYFDTNFYYSIYTKPTSK